ANDVHYLVQLSEKIKRDLESKDLLDFALQDCRFLTQEIGEDTPTALLYQDVGNYRHSRRQLMQLQQLMVWRDQIAKALNQPRSFILKNASMIDLVEKFPRNNFQLSSVKDIRSNVVREHVKTILDFLKFLPERAIWPLHMTGQIPHSSKDIGKKIDVIIHNVF